MGVKIQQVLGGVEGEIIKGKGNCGVCCVFWKCVMVVKGDSNVWCCFCLWKWATG